VLGIAWDSRAAEDGGQRWFHLYPDEAIDHRHPQHWTARDQTWNYQCAECHSTAVKKNYEAATDSYATTWAEISVGCEACHGPGAEHVHRMRELASGAARESGPDHGLIVDLTDRDGAVWIMDGASGNARRSVQRDRQTQVEICARCHSRRGQINEEYEHGSPLGNTHRLALLDDALYFPDGQIKDEVFVYGSFIQSRMHTAGVTCSDCHDPHSQRVHADGNALCARCHLPQRYDTPTHHHHEPATPGAACTSCHMPKRLYMVIDARADHSMRVPRPDLSVKFGTPNACTGCHLDQPDQWAAEAVATWYPESRHRGAHFAEALAAASTGEADAGSRLGEVAMDPDLPGIVRASAVDRLHFTAGSRQLALLPELVADSDPLVRTAALRLLERTDLRNQVHLGWPLLQDPVRVVRIEAARGLAPLLRQPLPENLREQLDRAIEEYLRAEKVNAERPEAQVNLGNLFVATGDLDSAARAYQSAIGLDAAFIPAYVNLADLYRVQQRDEDGERVLRAGLAVEGQNAGLQHALGLLLARGQRLDEALPHLRLAANAAPEHPRYAYVYGLALQSTGATAEALAVLERGRARHPADRDLLLALATMHRDRGELKAARQYADDLVTRYPDDVGLQNLRRELGPHDR
jgi:tetratricopeptide (TPR) repeat protein